MDLGYLEMGRMEIPHSASHCCSEEGVGLMSTELPGFLLVFRGRVWSPSGAFITPCLQKASSSPRARVSCLGSFRHGTDKP